MRYQNVPTSIKTPAAKLSEILPDFENLAGLTIQGIHHGYVVEFNWNSKTYVLHIDSGVRGRVPVNLVFSSDGNTVDMFDFHE